MRIISSIENGEIIKAILKHLGLWLVRSGPVPYLIREPSPKAHGPPSVEYVMDNHSQIPINDDHLYQDPEYPWDAYIQA